jgi:hypothetical protein
VKNIPRAGVVRLLAVAAPLLLITLVLAAPLLLLTLARDIHFLQTNNAYGPMRAWKGSYEIKGLPEASESLFLINEELNRDTIL